VRVVLHLGCVAVVLLATGCSGKLGTAGDAGSTVEGGVDVDAGVDCGQMPILHMNPPGDIRCGFGADGGALECLGSSGEGWCCVGASLGQGMYGPQSCAPNSDSCPFPSMGGFRTPSIQCNQIADCRSNGAPGATACCLGAELYQCMYPEAVGGSIFCEGSNGGAATRCGVNEIQICSSNVDCPPGTFCTPGKWDVFQLGFCL
jgi:hypothetical protein